MKKTLIGCLTLLCIINIHAQEKVAGIKIGNQIWMAKNLDVTTYRNGDIIPEVKDSLEWSKLKTGAWCYAENDAANGKIYGKLYNGYAVNDPRGLAPNGWHVPAQTEWKTLGKTLGGVKIAGGKMKEKGTKHWLKPNTGATNSSGLGFLPGGFRAENGRFLNLGQCSYWWSSSKDKYERIGYIYLLSMTDYLNEDYVEMGTASFIRCVKD